MAVNKRKLRQALIDHSSAGDVPDMLARLREAIDISLEDEFLRDNYSQGYIRYLLEGTRGVSVDERIELIEELRHAHPVDWQVTYGLAGVTTIAPVSVGNVTVWPGGEQERTNYVEATLDKFFSQNDKKRDNFRKSAMTVLGMMHCGSLLQVGVKACDAQRAEEIGVDRSADFISVLRYFSYRKHQTVLGAIGIYGLTPVNQDFPQWAMAENRYAVGYEPSSSRNFELSDEAIRWMNDEGFPRAVAILTKNEQAKTEMERRVLASLNWIGESLIETDYTDGFVKLCIAMEALLGHDDPDANITMPLAEKIAFLTPHLHAAEQRVALYRRVKELYGQRSKIVHRGKAITDPNLVSELRTIMVGVVSVFLESDLLDRFTRWNDFTKWIDERRFKGTEDFINE